jgi:hypothetical protein
MAEGSIDPQQVLIAWPSFLMAFFPLILPPPAAHLLSGMHYADYFLYFVPGPSKTKYKNKFQPIPLQTIFTGKIKLIAA